MGERQNAADEVVELEGDGRGGGLGRVVGAGHGGEGGGGREGGGDGGGEEHVVGLHGGADEEAAEGDDRQP